MTYIDLNTGKVTYDDGSTSDASSNYKVKTPKTDSSNGGSGGGSSGGTPKNSEQDRLSRVARQDELISQGYTSVEAAVIANREAGRVGFTNATVSSQIKSERTGLASQSKDTPSKDTIPVGPDNTKTFIKMAEEAAAKKAATEIMQGKQIIYGQYASYEDPKVLAGIQENKLKSEGYIPVASGMKEGEVLYAKVEKKETPENYTPIPVEKPQLKEVQSSILREASIKIQIAKREAEKQQEINPTLISSVILSGVAGYEFVKGFGTSAVVDPIKFGYNLITSPIQTGKAIYQSLTPTGIKQTGITIGESLQSKPVETIGKGAGAFFGPKAIEKVITRPIRNVYVKAGASEVSTAQTFASEVLEGKSKFPLTSSSTQTIQRVQSTVTPEGKLVVVSASQQPLKGNIIGEGSRAVAGLEDPGLYATSKGRASPYFLGIKAEASDFLYSDVKISATGFVPKTPTLTQVEVFSVSKLPKSVLEQPGFKPVSEFQKQLPEKSVALVTKRSQIGLGEVKGKGFQGTIEEEVVIPVGAEIRKVPSKKVIGKIKGYDEYTTYEGYAVPIRKYEVVGSTGEKVIIKSPEIKGKSGYGSGEYYPQSKTKIQSPLPKVSTGSTPSYSVKSSYSTPSSVVSYSSKVFDSLVSDSSSVSDYSSKVSSSVSKGYSGSSYSSPSSSSITSNESSGSSKVSEYSSPMSSSSYSSGRSYASSGYSSGYSSTSSSTSTGLSVIPPVYPTKRSKKRDERRRKAGFIGVVKRKGEFFELPGVYATEAEAKTAASKVVGTSASATFFTKSVGKEVTSKETGRFKFENFYTKEEKGKTLYIEKASKRIKSEGELREITYKGVAAIRSGATRKNKTMFG